MILFAASLLIGCQQQSPSPSWRGQATQFELGTTNGALADNSLSYGTYNLCETLHPGELQKDMIATPANVWGFQELVCSPTATPDPKTTMQQFLPPGKWFIAAVMMNETDEGSSPGWESQAIASRWPIKSVEVWPLPAAGPRHRVALVAVVETPVGEVKFVNTDHEVSFFSFEYGSRESVQELSRRLKDDPAQHVIVGGDFNSAGNLWRLQFNGGAVSEINAMMLSAGMASLPNRTVGEITFHGTWGTFQFDHLFFRGVTCSSWQTPKTFGGSDHLPLVGHFEFSNLAKP